MLQLGSELARRIRQLQPYWHAEPDLHPMRLLAEHTNHSKHRAPTVALVQIGPIVPDRDIPGLVVVPMSVDGPPAKPGDVLLNAANGIDADLSIWCAVSVERPHTGSMRIAMQEISEIFEWMRKEAIPVLVAEESPSEPRAASN